MPTYDIKTIETKLDLIQEEMVTEELRSSLEEKMSSIMMEIGAPPVGSIMKVALDDSGQWYGVKIQRLGINATTPDVKVVVRGLLETMALWLTDPKHIAVG